MTVKRPKCATGVTLIEIMVAILILTVAVIGASAYRYYTALDARKAGLQTTAARIACLLCETWRGTSDPNTFDPVASLGPEVTISSVPGYGPDVPQGFTGLGRYEISVNDAYYWSTLSWQDVSPGLRALNIMVDWDSRGSGYPGQSGFSQADKSFKLTTYVAN